LYETFAVTVFVSESRRDEPAISWEELKTEMLAEEAAKDDVSD
jgi:hypothetical protein